MPSLPNRLLFCAKRGARRNEENALFHKNGYRQARMPLSFAMALAGLSGFIALGFEIAWYRDSPSPQQIVHPH